MSKEAYSRTKPLPYPLQLSVPEGRGFFSCRTLMALCTCSDCACDDQNWSEMKCNKNCKLVGVFRDIFLACLR